MKDILINEEFLETIRTYKSFGTFESEETKNIVPHILRHEYLLNLRLIDKVIIESYIEDNKRLLTEEEWNKLPSIPDFDIYSNALSPFPYIIAGAYHSRINLYIKLRSLLHPYDQYAMKGKKELKYLSDLMPYFTEYAQGFRVGFNGFDDNLIKPVLINLGVPDKEGYATEVFNFVTRNQTRKPMTTNGKGFTTTYIGKGVYEINNGYPDGVNEGYLYRAWCIIFSQSKLFAPLFQEHSNSSDSKNESNTQAKFSINHIALKHYYEKTFITRENSDSIAKQYGHTSGEKLYQRFTHYSSRANRKGIPPNCTPKKLHNKIKLFESVIKTLRSDCISEATDEVNILKAIAEKEDY